VRGVSKEGRERGVGEREKKGGREREREEGERDR
jgi:hypothetical protein